MSDVQTVTTTVPDDKIGLVIGRGGAGLTRIRQETEVKITVPTASESLDGRTVELTGTLTQIADAQFLMRQFLDGTIKATSENMQVGIKRKLGMAFDSNTMQQQIPTYGAPLPPGFRQPGQYMMMPQGGGYGWPAAPVRSMQLASAPVGSAKILLEGNTVGRVIGKAGAGLKELRTTSSAKFDLAREPIFDEYRVMTVEPPLDAQQRCVAYICSKISSSGQADSAPDGQVTLRMLLSSSSVGRVIGKAGAGLKRLRTLGVKVDLPREEPVPGERVITLVGASVPVQTAVVMILEMVGSPQSNPPGGTPANKQLRLDVPKDAGVEIPVPAALGM